MPKVQVQDEQGNIVATKKFDYSPEGEQLAGNITTDLEGHGTLVNEAQAPGEQDMYYSGGMVDARERSYVFEEGGRVMPSREEWKKKLYEGGTEGVKKDFENEKLEKDKVVKSIDKKLDTMKS